MARNFQSSKLNDYVANQNSFDYKFLKKNFEIFIHKGNLLDQNVDIIVNAANRSLMLGGY